ncbi:histidinol-phosphate transaminase [Bacillus sp. S/N-304-OC-R1]|uniref:histidinol-phosphate transaminase n=1 Tax=Bacillus sp. S/N-304-OC-R1 TaxID=2758034 RepID=UPI001C8F1221|nr:histidinol-phosphate transaminase [Bacillus sp. S/N-304-OC-R1]MBY0122593.1 histidinol-phosphate transaminase [Bacillus sp. S/N-304-OC-R1]
MKWKEQLLQLTPYQPGKPIDEVKRQYGLENIIKLASNENPFGCSEKVTTALKCNSAAFPLYPDGNATNLREKIASHFGLSPSQFIFGNGADNIIQIISRALLKPGTNTVMSAGTFSQYKHNAIIDGAEVREVAQINGEHDLEGMLKVIDEATSVVWVCNPNNPTGTYIPENELVSFLEKVPSDILVVIDEAYNEYVVAEDYCQSVNLLDRFPNIIILRTFSKIYGLASLRVGYGISHSEIIRALEPAREPFNVSTIAQEAAIAALEDQDYVAFCKQKNREGLQQFYLFCDENGLSYYPSQANFVLIDFNKDGNEVFQYLLERGFIVRSGKALGFPTCVRVTVGSKEQNDGVIGVMSDLLTEKTILS